MTQKSEAPTPRRLRQAKEKGQFARSRLMTGAAVTFAAWTVGARSLPLVAQRMTGWFPQLLSGGTRPQEALHQGLELLVQSLAAPLLAATAAALLAGVLQAGLQFRPSHIAPKWERVDVVKGFQRMFSARQWLESLKLIGVSAVVAGLGWQLLRAELPAMVSPLFEGRNLEGPVLLLVLQRVGYPLCAALGVLGIADFAHARWKHTRDLRMSKDEVRREHKESEGDPRHKNHRRAQHRQLSAAGPARGVGAATAVVVNPTHLAIALRHDESECDAPYLVAKARDEDALLLRREALLLGIPIVKDIPLARGLIQYDLGELIPQELYEAAAVVLHQAEQLRQSTRFQGT
jgi:type III secretion protein U